MITRRPLARTHGKLRTFVHGDFLDYGAATAAFDDLDACFYCLGISATQVSGEEEYRRITHDFAMTAASALKRDSPNAVFHFISGQGTRLDSRMMWARVKAETERDLLALGNTVCWRPAFIDGETTPSAPRVYQAIRPLFRLLKGFRGLYVSGEDIGRAMIRATVEGVRGRTIENREIREMADLAHTAARR